MNLKKLYILLLLCISLLSINSVFYASDTQVEDRYISSTNLENSIAKTVDNTNFNGTVMVSRNNGDSYDILYQDAIGTDGGYNIDTVYDIGSVSKVYTTTAIMLLQQDGKLNYSDPINQYIEGVPEDKKDVTIKMLLTHSSGIYAEENVNHDVTKEAEIKRILSTNLNFEPGTNYIYSNAGFTLLAAIIEDVSGQTYEDYLTENIFDPLGLESTGFPNSNYLKDNSAVSGTLNGVNYGKVTDFDFGWYSKGYTDILTTPKELTYFFNAMVSGKLLNEDNLKLMNSRSIEINSETYRGYGTERNKVGTNTEVVGHSGVWYGGNTAAYYRPADKLVFIYMCDQLNTANDLPANHAFNSLNAMYPAGELDNQSPVDNVSVNDLIVPVVESMPEFDVAVSEIDNNQLIDPQSKSTTISALKNELIAIIHIVSTNREVQLIIVCMLAIMLIVTILTIRFDRKGKSTSKQYV